MGRNPPGRNRQSASPHRLQPSPQQENGSMAESTSVCGLCCPCHLCSGLGRVIGTGLGFGCSVRVPGFGCGTTGGGFGVSLMVKFSVERRRPPTPALGRGLDCGLKVEWSWQIELAAGQVLGAPPCSTSWIHRRSSSEFKCVIAWSGNEASSRKASCTACEDARNTCRQPR